VDGVELFNIRKEKGAENEIRKGDRLPMVPDHPLRAGAAISLPRGIGLGAAASCTGERWPRGDEANDEMPLAG